MNWTKKTPTEEDGYYWWRENISYIAKIVSIQDGRLYRIGIGFDNSRSPAIYGGEWFGPLQEPGGDAIENCS